MTEYESYKPSKDDSDLMEPFQSQEPGAVVGAQYCLQKAEQFTLDNAIFNKNWSITKASGQEIFRLHGKRVDWCKPKRTLVDLDGNPIVHLKMKKWTWFNTWRAYEPENREQPLWTLKKFSFCNFKKHLAIFLPSNSERNVPDYSLKANIMCKKTIIYFGKQKVAEVVREASLQNILSRKSIYHVIVQPGVDTVFIFSLIVMMDRIFVHGHKN